MKKGLMKKTIICFFVVMMGTTCVSADILKTGDAQDAIEGCTAEDKNITMTVTTDQLQYPWLFQRVLITLTLENIGNESVTLTFPTTQLFDIFVQRTSSDRVVFIWSHGQSFSQVMGNATLVPGSSLSFSYAWPQKGNIFGRTVNFIYPVFPGIFRVMGVIATTDHAYLNSTEFVIGNIFHPVQR